MVPSVGENSSCFLAAVRVRRVRGSPLVVGALIAALLGVAATAGADPMTTSPEQAYDQGQIPTARGVAMGDALNAVGVSTPALFMNPANLPLARVYHLEAFAAYSPEAMRQTYGLAIVDSVLNAAHVSGGLGGTWNQMDPDGLNRTWTDVRAALAAPLGDYLSFGLTGRYLNVSQNRGAGPFGPSYASDGNSSGSLFNQLTFDAGATAILGDFRVGLVGHNLTNPATSLAPTTGALGLGYTSQVFSAEVDGMADFTTYGSTTGRIMGGLELFLSGHYALRGGWRYDTGTTLNTPSLGFGYIDTHWSAELSARHDIVATHAETLGILSLKYFYDAVGTTGSSDEPDPI
jgi:hypothetical protein